ncbi:MAG: 50S ribosomal protein L10 [Patescibacteria group bacterium]
MAKTKEQKKKIIDGLKDKIKKAKSIIFTKFNGLEVKENEELRHELRDENSEYYVAKKTLLSLVLKDEKIEGLENFDLKNMEGQIAAVFGYGDEIIPAKVLDKFRKGHPNLKANKEDKIEFIAGILENKLIDAEKVMALAQLPSKLELYAKMVGSLNAPISGLVNSLAGNLRNLVYVLKAIEKNKV